MNNGNDPVNVLAEKIVMELALMMIQGHGNEGRKELLEKYGEFGFEIAKELINEKLKK
jgi:hypothetical protein